MQYFYDLIKTKIINNNDCILQCNCQLIMTLCAFLIIIICSSVACDSGSSDDSINPTETNSQENNINQNNANQNNANQNNNNTNENNSTSVINKTSQITHHGITWYFDKDYEYGQYATGDYWVVGPVTIENINPQPNFKNETYLHGSMINPAPLTEGNSYQGWTSETVYYKHELNVGMPNGEKISSSNPLVVTVHSSLCSSISRSEGIRPFVDTIAILTVVETKPDEGDFRPSYISNDKTSQYNLNDIDFSIVDKKIIPVTSTEDISVYEAYLEKPWIDIVYNYRFGDLAPLSNMAVYGREYSHITSEVPLMLMMDISNEEKRILMLRYVQLGLDLYAIMKSGFLWMSQGGWMHGRKLPILFTGMVLNDTNMINDVTAAAVSSENPKIFQEDGQHFYISESDVAIDHATWSGAPRPSIEYIQGDADNNIPEWGIGHDHTASYDNRNWLADYRAVVGSSSVATALAVYFLEARSIWGNEAFFDYMDRYMTNMSVLSDHEWSEQGTLFGREMWNEYRSNFLSTHPLWTAPSEWTEFPWVE